jgi:hypothetical protein
MLTARRDFIVGVFMVPFFSRLVSMWQKPASKAQNASPSAGKFSVFRGEKDGYPLFAMIDVSLRDYKSKASFPLFLSISTPLINPAKDGLTTDQDSSALNDWEDLLESKIAAECRFVYVGHVTWNGSREILYYVDKSESVVPMLKKLADGHSTRRFAFRCERDDKWDSVKVYFGKP